MPMGKLEPHDLTSPRGAASTYTGVAIVRAPTEHAARDCAHEAFFTMGEVIPGADTLLGTPWQFPEQIHCTKLTDSGYAEEGEPGVLDP